MPVEAKIVVMSAYGCLGGGYGDKGGSLRLTWPVTAYVPWASCIRQHKHVYLGQLWWDGGGLHETSTVTIGFVNG